MAIGDGEVRLRGTLRADLMPGTAQWPTHGRVTRDPAEPGAP